MRRPALALALAATAATGFVLAAPSSARVVLPERAGAVTVITATHSGSAQLVLFDDATLSPSSTANPDISIEGAGRLVGFALTSLSNDSSAAPDQVSGWRLPRSVGGGMQVSGSTTPQAKCAQFPDSALPQNTCNVPEPKAILLHEGYYRLDVLTDGAPVRITLRLHGERARRAAVHLQSTFRSAETNLVSREAIGSSTVTFGGQIAGFGKPTEVLYVAAAKTHDAATFKSATLCLRSDTGAPPPYAFSPACPGGQNVAYDYTVSTPTGQRTGGMGVSAGSLVPTGDPNGLGGSVSDSDGPTFLGGVAVWVASNADTQPFDGAGPYSQP